jgi:hypothetical protein
VHNTISTDSAGKPVFSQSATMKTHRSATPSAIAWRLAVAIETSLMSMPMASVAPILAAAMAWSPLPHA